MSLRDVYIAEETHERLLQEHRDRAETSRLVRQLRTQRRGRLSELLIQILHRVGQRLLAVGTQPGTSKPTHAGLAPGD